MQEQEQYVHWSKNPNYKGYTQQMSDRPEEKADNARFRKDNTERAKMFAAKLKFKQEQVKTHGADWKKLYKANLTTTKV